MPGFKSATYLIFRRDDQILLTKRKNTGFRDGQMVVPAGKIEHGETWAEAGVREAMEEIGVHLEEKDLELKHILYRKPDEDDRMAEDWFDYFVEVKSWTGTPKNTEPEKCEFIDWYDRTDLPYELFDYVRLVLDRIDAGERYSDFNVTKSV